jgi:ADP-ribose pyrophosphatase YjhB (NUDIX family)
VSTGFEWLRDFGLCTLSRPVLTQDIQLQAIQPQALQLQAIQLQAIQLQAFHMHDSEADFLEHYSIHDYDIPLVSVDIAIFTLLDSKLHLLLVERGDHPHRGRWALPGGFINLQTDPDLHACALRKLQEKTGVKAPHLEQVVTVGNTSRDPRGWSVTVLYMALIPYAPTAGWIASVADCRWWPYEAALRQNLAFDHKTLITQARERLRSKSSYTVLPIYVLNAPFTLTQLQQAFEELLGADVEKKSFRRRMQAADLLEVVGEGLPEGGRGRLAALYRPKKGSEQHAFIRAFGVDDGA